MTTTLLPRLGDTGTTEPYEVIPAEEPMFVPEPEPVKEPEPEPAEV